MYGVIRLNEKTIPSNRGRGNAKKRKSSTSALITPSPEGSVSPNVSPILSNGSTKLAVRRASPSSSTSSNGSNQRAITFIDYSATISNPQPEGHIVEKRRKDVRVHAAMASAEKRKATIARKDAYGWQRRARLLNAIQMYETESARENSEEQEKHYGEVLDRSQAACELINEVVIQMPPNRSWNVRTMIERSSLPGKAIRTTLLDAIVNSSTLLPAAIFIAGTHSNTCGLPPDAIHDLGSGLILLRGASLAAIQAAVISSKIESVTPIAIAMLAGWERRFGDQTSYEIHLHAWKSLNLPPSALDENAVTNLADLTLETFRESLDERAIPTPATTSPTPIPPTKRLKRSPTPSSNPLPSTFYTTCPLPVRLTIFSPHRPETRSLLRLISTMHTIPALPSTPATMIPRLRRVGLENIAWNPSHSASVKSLPSVEEAWDPPEELNALYHVRAAGIVVGSLVLRRLHEVHCVPWPAGLDLDAALAVHVVSCQHLRTEELIGTRFAEVGVWTRFLLCAVVRDRERDGVLRELVGKIGWRDWEAVREVLGRYLWMEGLEGRCRRLWGVLMERELWDG